MGGGENSGLAPDMLQTLLVGFAALLLLCWCVIRVRRRVARLERAVEGLTRRTNELVDA